MRAIHLPVSVLEAMAAHARESYPEECCGLLIALPDPEDASAPRSILAVESASNEFPGERKRRFLVSPEELRTAERRLDRTGRAVVGFYHSHPDHPGRPSRFDQENAWPWYTYVVLGVDSTAVRESRAFELDPDLQEFREVPVTVLPDRPFQGEVERRPPRPLEASGGSRQR